MKKFSIESAAVIALLVGAIQAQGQSVNFNFSDGTADGWVDGGFSSSPAATVATIGGNNYIQIPIGGFQVANISSGNSSAPFYQAMAAAAANPAGYDITYNWLINTANLSGVNANSFLQLGLFVNGGDGAYHQDFSAPNEVQLSGAQLTSGQVLSGQVTVNMAAVGLDLPATETFFRLGLIENGDSGVPYQVDFTDISISPVPDTTSSLWLLGLAGAVLCMIPRRHLAQS